MAFEGLRGLAALLVVFYHVAAFEYWDTTLNQYGLFRNGWLAVDIFFVLSGFVMYYVYGGSADARNAVSFAIRRFGRLYPLHFVTLVAFVGVAFAIRLAIRLHWSATLGGGLDTRFLWFSPRELVSNVFLVHSLGVNQRLTLNVPSWSISVEFWTYLVFFLTLLLTSGGRRILAWLTIVTGSVAVLLLQTRYKDLEGLHHDYGFFRCLFGFFLGALLVPLRQRVAPRATVLPAVAARNWIAIAQVPVFVGVCLAVIFAHRWPAATFFYPFAFATLVFFLAQDEGPVAHLLKTRPCLYLGKISYSVYLTHFTLLTVFGAIANGKAGRDAAWLTPLYGVSVIAVSDLTYRYIEVPWREKFRRLADRYRAPA
ncbi:MAG TPA: acyltransferase [Polyangia bacterium]|nr:acyltransferase [Polyangia bacterium]